jgi:DNA-binding XRE family transcriptional regulator
LSNNTKKREPLRRTRPAKRAKRAAETKLDFQDPHAASSRRNSLELAIGREVRDFRRKLSMTVAELANMAGMSTGMLSKIENGQTSPSLATLQELS